MYRKPKDGGGQPGTWGLAHSRGPWGALCVPGPSQIGVTHTRRTTCPLCSAAGPCPGKIYQIDGLLEQVDWGRGDERAQVCVSVRTWPHLTFQVGLKDLGTTPLSSLRYLHTRRSARISGLRFILYNFPKILSRLGNSSRALLMC